MKSISINKKILEGIAKEVPQHFQSEEDLMDYDKLMSCAYTSRVIQEVLRRDLPTSVIFPRIINKDLKLGKFTLKKGDRLLIPIIGMHNNDRYFDNPTECRPERFTEEAKKKIKRNTYLPFFSGRRSCVGRYFAELMQMMVIGEFFTNFELRGTETPLRTEMKFLMEAQVCDLRIRPLIK